MTAVFETPQFRVHITHRTAWVESREPAGWVFRMQHAIPVPAEAIRDGAHPSTLKAALLGFEAARPWDNSLREALTGIQASKRAQIAPTVQPRPARLVSRSAADQKQLDRKQHGWRTPLRPPLKPALSGA